MLAVDRALTFSVREFELLVALARRAGAIVTREELYGAVWGGELRAGDRSVDVYVSKLRGKLEEAMPDRRFIHTHPGFGYRFQPQPWGSSPELSRDVHTGVPPIDETGRELSRRGVLHARGAVPKIQSEEKSCTRTRSARSRVARCSR